ncbi:MAG TPA: insulinase family protein, partial [Candidatus Ozemobacteraceae bacterium]|nr:insulinase family protein [Candidatus Ozemobacteraceae bacterium]
MNSIKRGFFFAVVLMLVAVPFLSAQQSYKDLKFPPLNDFKIPSVERVVLDNGLILFLLEDHELPTVNLSGFVRFHAGDEPADKIGLANLTIAVMRSGGTKTKSGDDVDLELDRMAAHIGFGAGATYGVFSASSLKDQWNKTLPLLMDIMKNPAFPEDKIELKKISSRSNISRRNDDPFPIAIREFKKAIYGPASPYARHTEYATIDAITRDDLVAFHQKHFHPERMMVA